MKKNNIILILLFMAMFCSAANIYFINVYKKQRETHIITLFNNFNTLLKTNEIISVLKDAEASQRAYLLSGESEDLEGFAIHSKKLNILEEEIINISSPESLKIKEQITELVMLSKNKSVDLSNSISSKNTGKINSSMNKILMKDKLYMKRLKALAVKIVNEENKLVKLNTAKLENDYGINSFLQSISLIFIFFMLVAAILILNRRRKFIHLLIDNLKRVNQTLEVKVEERTNELEISNEKLQLVNEELFGKNQLLKQSNELVQLQNNYLLEINEDKNKFIGMAAHDLRSPLMSIKGLIDLFKIDKEQLSAEHNEYLGYMADATSRMLRLINNLLNVNKIEMGELKVGLERFNIYPFIENIVYGYKAVTAQKNIKIIFANNDKDLEINSDKAMLGQIIENLLSNAIKFSPFDKSIFVRIFKEGRKIKIEVEDQGLGIQKEEIPHVFDKFNRISTKPTNGEDSTGLGLSIVKGILEDLHGKIEVESEVNKGTKFTLVFSE